MTYREECEDWKSVLTKVKNYIHDKCQARYENMRLTNEKELPCGIAIANPESIKSFIVSIFLKMQEEKKYGLEEGDDAVRKFEEYLEVSLNIEKAEIKIRGLLPLKLCQRELGIDEDAYTVVTRFSQIVDLSS